MEANLPVRLSIRLGFAAPDEDGSDDDYDERTRSSRWAKDLRLKRSKLDKDLEMDVWDAAADAGADVYSSDGHSSEDENDIGKFRRGRKGNYDHGTLARRLRSVVRSQPAKQRSFSLTRRVGNLVRSGSLSDKVKIGDNARLSAALPTLYVAALNTTIKTKTDH